MTVDWFGWLCRWVGVGWIVAGLLVGLPVMLPLGVAMLAVGQACGVPRMAVRDPDALSPNPPGWDEAVAAYMADPHATTEWLEAQWGLGGSLEAGRAVAGARHGGMGSLQDIVNAEWGLSTRGELR